MFFLTTGNFLILAIASKAVIKKWLLETEWWQKDLNRIRPMIDFSFLHQEFPTPKYKPGSLRTGIDSFAEINRKTGKNIGLFQHLQYL